MVDGKFLAEDSTAPAGQAIVSELLNRCFLWSGIVLTRCAPLAQLTEDSEANSHTRKGKIDERFKMTYDKLCEIRNQLERLSLTQAWSLRETDLYDYQRQLDRVDESRINGNFEDPTGYKADLHAQRVRLISHKPKSIIPNPYRLCSIFSAAAMRTSTVLSYLRNQSPRRSCQFSINYKPFVDVWSKSSDQVAFLPQGSFTLTV